MRTIYFVKYIATDGEDTVALTDPAEFINFMWDIKEHVYGMATWTLTEFQDGSYIEDENYHQEFFDCPICEREKQ